MKAILDICRSRPWLLHLLYWICFVLFFGLVWGSHNEDYADSLVNQLLGLPSRFILVYVSLYILVPKFFLKGRFFTFSAFYLILLALTSLLIQRPLMYFFVQPTFFENWHTEGLLTPSELLNTALDVNHAGVLPLMYTFFKYYYDGRQRALILEKENIEAQFVRLRNQVHPHFLFNTLNNLYALIIKKSPEAEEAVLKLSRLMRYMLYEANTESVLLSKEIRYLKDYVALEKLRLDSEVAISFTTEIDREYLIPPFLMNTFVENAFKHISSVKSQNWITIIVIAMKNQMEINVQNSKCPDQKSTEHRYGGLGFQNLKKRLSLLYQKEHDMVILDHGSSYEVNLKLKLSPYVESKENQVLDSR